MVPRRHVVWVPGVNNVGGRLSNRRQTQVHSVSIVWIAGLIQSSTWSRLR